jgi:hypothetical protein
MEFKRSKAPLIGWHKHFAWLPVCVAVNWRYPAPVGAEYVWLGFVECMTLGKATVYRRIK